MGQESTRGLCTVRYRWTLSPCSIGIYMRNLAAVFSLAALLPSMPLHAVQATAAIRQRAVSTAVQNSAPVAIKGTVVTSAGQPFANAVVRARNLLTGRI